MVNGVLARDGGVREEGVCGYCPVCARVGEELFGRGWEAPRLWRKGLPCVWPGGGL